MSCQPATHVQCGDNCGQRRATEGLVAILTNERQQGTVGINSGQPEINGEKRVSSDQ
jgi:hypothetical protein